MGPLVLYFTPRSFLLSCQIGTKLSYDVLNSDHVPPSLTNSQTLGTVFSSRMRWSNIEVPNHPVDMVSWGWLACYPRRTFYSLSGNLFHTELPDHYNRLSSLLDLSILQSGKYLLLCFKIVLVQFKFTFARLRYSLGGDRPSQTTHYTLS